MAGAEIYAFNLAREMKARALDISVLSPAHRKGVPEYSVVEEIYQDLRVLRLNNNYTALHALDLSYADPDLEARFDEVLASEKPDIIHLHHTIGTTANSATIAKARGIPVVLTLHDFWFHCPRGQRMTPRRHLCKEVQPWRCALCVAKKRGRYGFDWLHSFLAGTSRDAIGKNALSRAVEVLPRLAGQVFREAGTAPIKRRQRVMVKNLAAVDLILAPSRFIADEYIRQGAPADRVVFSEYGMDHSRFEQMKTKARKPGDPIRFAFTGTLLQTKGIELLIKAFQGIPFGAATLDLHGSAQGPDPLGYTVRLKSMNQHPGLRFRGRFDNLNIAEIMAEIDVLCVPSLWWENAPLTLHEAAMSNTAVVTSGHGGMAEFVERFGNGLTFEPGSEDSLAATLRRFLDEPDLLSFCSTPKRPVRSVAEDVDGLVEHYQRLLSIRPS